MEDLGRGWGGGVAARRKEGEGEVGGGELVGGVLALGFLVGMWSYVEFDVL
jgi:hypothetical protein